METEDINPVGAYNLMRDALRAAGRPILSVCVNGDIVNLGLGQRKPVTCGVQQVISLIASIA